MRASLSAIVITLVWAVPMPAQAWVFDEAGRAAPEQLRAWRVLNELSVAQDVELASLGRSFLRTRSFSSGPHAAALLLEELALFAAEFERELSDMAALPSWLRQGPVGLALTDARLRELLQSLLEEALLHGQDPEQVCAVFAALLERTEDDAVALETVYELLSCSSDTGCELELARDLWFELDSELEPEETLQVFTDLALLAADNPGGFPAVWKMYQQLSHLGAQPAVEGVETISLMAVELGVDAAAMLRDYRSLAELEGEESDQSLPILLSELQRRLPAGGAWASHFELFRQLRSRLLSAWDCFDLIEQLYILAEGSGLQASQLGGSLLPILDQAAEEDDLPSLVQTIARLAEQHGHALADLGALYAGLREDGVASEGARSSLSLLSDLAHARKIPLTTLRAIHAQLLAAEEGMNRDRQTVSALTFVAGFEPKSGRGFEACVAIWLRMRTAEDSVEDAIGNLELVLHAATEGADLDTMVGAFLGLLEKHGGVRGTALARRDFQEQHIGH